MPHNPRVLLLIPTTSYRAADFLAAAERLGVAVTVGSEAQDVLAEIAPQRRLRVDFADAERGAAQIVAFAERYSLSAIVGVDEGTTTLAALASQRLGLAHNAPDAVAAAGNKYRFREILTDAGLPQPNVRLFSIDEDPPAAARRINSYPVVLKPLSLAASRGVMRADDAEGFATAFERIRGILAATRRDTGFDPKPWVLGEEYLPGGEVALEGLLIGGRLHVLALFDKPDPMEGPTFEETIFVTPSRLSDETQELIRQRSEAAIAALGLTEGPVHAELRITPDQGPVPLEVAARSIGGLCARTLRFGTGVGLEDLILQHALGADPASLSRERTPAGVMMLPVPRAGTLRRIEGQGAARHVPGIVELTISIAPGTHVQPLPEGDRYLGFIFARADTPDKVEAALRGAAAKLTPVIDAEG